MKQTILTAALILGGMLSAANADTWVFKDMLRPNGHERRMAAKRADARQCGAARSGQSFNDARAPNITECMFAHGWTLDHIIPDPPSARARARQPEEDSPPPQIDTSADDQAQRKRDWDNQQNFNNTQQMINNQQMQNDQMFQQQQQQMINDMNNR